MRQVVHQVTGRTVGGMPVPQACSTSHPAEMVIVVGGTSWDDPMWHSERHVALHLSARIPVLWIDPPLSLVSSRRPPNPRRMLRDSRLTQVHPNIWRLTPVTVPGVSRPLLRDIANWQCRRATQQATRAIGARIRATIVASFTDMLEVVPGSRRVFYATDDFVAGAMLMGVSGRWLEKMERRQLECADVVIAVSEELHRKWIAKHDTIVVVPNGCDAARFAATDEAPLPADVRLPSPIAGYVGLMSERVDLRMLESVADTGASLLLVGPRQPTYDIGKMEPLLARSNVQWVGGKAFEDIPSYMRIIDVGLTPYAQTAFNRGSWPLKTIEYLAAGRPVVATDLPAHRELDTPEIAIARTPDEFATLTSALLARGSSPETAAATRAFARRHSWSERTDLISQAIGLEG